MTIELLYNKSENDALVKNLESVITMNGTLRSETDVNDPVAMVEINQLIDVTKCNYARIPEFNRYYHLKVESVRNNLWRLIMHVDVLTSWADYIKATPALISRYQSGEELIMDDAVQLYSNPYNSITPFSNTFEGNQNYILVLIGKQPEVT